MTGGKKVLSFPCLARESREEMSGTSPNMTIIYLSLSALSRQSRDPRNVLRLSEDDRREKKYCHSRAWHGNLKKMSGSSPNMTKRKISTGMTEEKKNTETTKREESQGMTKKIQGTASRYAHRKHRASTKVRAATSERSRASPCQAGYSLRYTFF